MITINNKSDDMVVVEVYGDILSDDFEIFKDMFDSITIPKDIKSVMNTSKNKTITFNINSNGGDVVAGTYISNLIREYKGKTIANIQSVAASISSVIALSCDEVKMPKNAYLMVHKPWCSVYGNADDLKNIIETLDTIQQGIESIYKLKANEGITDEDIRNLVNNSTWLNGEDAKKYFNITLIDDVKILNCITNIKHKGQPNIFKDKIEYPNELIDKIRNLKEIKEI